MSDKKDNEEVGQALGEEGRRKLLKKLGAGSSGVAIAAWTAPIVTAVSHSCTCTDFWWSGYIRRTPINKA